MDILPEDKITNKICPIMTSPIVIDGVYPRVEIIICYGDQCSSFYTEEIELFRNGPYEGTCSPAGSKIVEKCRMWPK